MNQKIINRNTFPNENEMNPGHISSSTFKLSKSIDVLPSKTKPWSESVGQLLREWSTKEISYSRTTPVSLESLVLHCLPTAPSARWRSAIKLSWRMTPIKEAKETGPLPSFSNKFSSGFFSFRDPDKPLWPSHLKQRLRFSHPGYLVVSVGSKRSCATFFPLLLFVDSY